MNKKMILLTPLISLMPIITISCVKNNFNTNKYRFIEKNNYGNDYASFSYLDDNYTSKNIHKINLATAAKLIRIKSSQQPLIDFRDNIVLAPSELHYKLEWANKINITTPIGTNEYSNDNTDIVDYENESNKPENGIFKPKKDKGNGFNSPFLFVPSSDIKSINNPNFAKDLNNTNKVIIEIKNRDNVWINYLGNIINTNNHINHKSFKLGLLSKLLRNKEYRHSFAAKHKIDLSKYNNKKLQKNDGFDLYNYLIQNDIDVDALLNFDNNKITIKTRDGSFKNLKQIFDNILIIQNYLDAIPYEIIESSYKDPLKNLDWFFNYGETYQNRFYASNYFISHMNANETTLKINKNYQKNEDDNLKEIIIQYNSLPLSQSTFSLQSLNAFKQNIISKIEYEDLNLDEKNYILENYKKYNFSYQKNYNRYSINNNIIINQNPDIKTKYMNKNFMKLYYGLKDNNSLELSKNNLTFQSLFNNLINQYSLIEDDKNLWLSQAPENLDILASNEAIGISELKDAYNQISKPIIFGANNKKLSDTFQYQNKNRLNDPLIVFVEDKIKSTWFKFIETNLRNIIDNFYKTSNSNENIYVNIPIMITKDNQFINKRILLIKKIFNSIDRRLNIDITKIDNFEKYQEFFERNKSIYKKSTFKLFQGTTPEYLYKQLTNFENNLNKLIDLISKNKKDYLTSFEQIISLHNFLVNNNINLKNSLSKTQETLFITYLSNLEVENQLKLINEINNLISYSINLINQININSFSKIIYQNNIIKPLGWNNLNYLQDIKIK
ncbi:OppA family ABC transporter substrate-binding lipoprotein [Mycoplasma sp. 1781]